MFCCQEYLVHGAEQKNLLSLKQMIITMLMISRVMKIIVHFLSQRV